MTPFSQNSVSHYNKIKRLSLYLNYGLILYESNMVRTPMLQIHETQGCNMLLGVGERSIPVQMFFLPLLQANYLPLMVLVHSYRYLEFLLINRQPWREKEKAQVLNILHLLSFSSRDPKPRCGFRLFLLYEPSSIFRVV